jgi:hypothetical protein
VSGRATLAFLCALAGSSAAAADPAQPAVEWLARESAGILPLGDESVLTVRGVAGTIELRTHALDELRWASVAARASTPLPLEVGSAERGLVLQAPEGDTAPRRVLVSVPARLSVRVEGEGAQVVGDNVQSDVSVSGGALDVLLSAQAGSIEVDVQDGAVQLDRPRGPVVLRGRPKTARVLQARGLVRVQAGGGTVEVQDAAAGVDVDAQGTKLLLTRVQPPVRVHARDGEVRGEELPGGGDFELERTPLRLEKGTGEITVSSDSLVEFHGSYAAVHVHGLGAPVKGSDHQGLVEIETDSAEVLLSKIDGPLRVRGNSLQLRLEQTAETGLITSSSNIELNGVDGPLAIENELGSVQVRGASDKVEVKNRDGDVSLLGLSASAVVQTSSERLTVGWSSFPRDAQVENVLINEDGVILVELPAGGPVLLEAESRYGRVESALPWVRVAEDGKSAQGMVGRGTIPRLRVVGAGGVVLGGPGSSGQPASDPADE